MSDRTYLGELEQMTLWTVLRVGENAYGPRILAEIHERVGRTVTPGALYATLDRLESKGMIASQLADADSGRGGRRRRYVSVTAEGREALALVRHEWMSLWEGVHLAVGRDA
jgi:DNA-binding PadR family transcriptional regulator